MSEEIKQKEFDAITESRLCELLKKYDIKGAGPKMFITEMLRIISTGRTPTYSEVSRNIGRNEEYGRGLIFRKPNVAACVNEMFMPDMNMMYEKIRDIASMKCIDEHVVLEGTGPGTSKAVVVKTAPSAQTVQQCINSFMKVQKDFEAKLINIKAKNQNSFVDNNEEDNIDIHGATLEALKAHKVVGFDDDPEDEQDETDSNAQDA